VNPDKISKWMDFAKSFTGNEFWSDLFEQPRPQDYIGRSPFSSGKQNEPPALFPSADVMTSENEILVLVDLPGVSKEDIQLSINDEALYIKGESKPLYPSCTPVSTERFSGSFERPIGLPARIDGQTAKIKATFHNGTLIVRIAMPPVWKKSIPID